MPRRPTCAKTRRSIKPLPRHLKTRTKLKPPLRDLSLVAPPSFRQIGSQSSPAVPHPSSDELLIARLFDLPAADRPTFWQRACADDPLLRNRHPEFSRLFLASEANGTAPGEIATPAVIPDVMAGAHSSTLNGTGHDAPGARLGPMA